MRDLVHLPDDGWRSAARAALIGMTACLWALAVALATATALDAQTTPAPPPSAAPEAPAQPPQTTPAPPPSAAPETPAQPAQPAQPVFRQEEIDQMVAPIALYPDQLLAQILMAATYPLEIVQAERWLRDPANASLKGDQLAAALESQNWDPSVKSLVPFPQVLGMMNDKLDWTERLGDAFLAQEADVMASAQRLRKQAQAAGSLKSTEQQTVTVAAEGDNVVIQPANPQVVYVPSYNPSVVYGTWPYPAYPPVYYPPPPAYYPAASAFVSGLAFAGGVALVGSLSGWGNCNWNSGSVNINAARYNTINANNIRAGRATALSANATTWRHDPAHRRGVAYRDPATRQAYQRQAGTAAANRNFRGYGAGQGTSRGAAAASTQQRRTAAAASTGRGSAAASTQQRRAAAGAAGARPAASGTSAARRPNASARQPSAFQGMGNGADVRAQSQRGQASRQSAMSSSRAGGGAARAGGGARGGGGGGGRGGRR